MTTTVTIGGTLGAEIVKLRAQLTSLRASLDDAHETIRRLSAEKKLRDDVIRAAGEVLERVHRQGELGGE